MNKGKEQNKVILFTESNGRIIIGEFIDQYEYNSGQRIIVKNPQVVQTYQKDDGMSIGKIPYVFVELVASEEDVIWEFVNVNICKTEPTPMALNTYEQVVQRGRLVAKKINEEYNNQTKTETSDKVIQLVD